MRRTSATRSLATAVVLAAGLTVAAAPAQRPVIPVGTPLSALWEDPQELAQRDLYYGPWGREHAPDPEAVYSYVRPKGHGVNPGVVVKDPAGRVWHVKQSAPQNREGAEGPVEVVLSRVLSAVGYHQPPVYYLPSFKMKGPSGLKPQPGGRFRLSDKRLKVKGEWAWLDNPFADTTQLRGLLAMLMVFNSSDLKTANNKLYEVRDGDTVTRWLVVRDLGTALGETGRAAPRRNDPTLLAREPLIAGVRNGYVQFNFHGLRKEILRDRLTPDDVVWGCALLSRLSDRQWRDAFRAGGYAPELAERFIKVLQARIAEGLRLGDTEEHRSRQD